MARIGDGHVAAMARLGLKELRNAANPSRESAADSEIGLYGTATQGEIAESRGGAGEGPEQESPSSTLSLDDLRGHAQERSQEAERGKDQEKDKDQDPGKENDRGGPER